MSLFAKYSLILSSPFFIFAYFFPKIAENIFTNVTYSIVYGFSKIQIYVTKKIEYIKNKPLVIFLTNYFYGTKNIEFIKDNKVVLYKKKEDVMNNSEYYKENLLYDFFIYSDTDNTKNKIYKSIYFYMPNSFEYSVCHYTFISINIIFSQKEIYSIELKDGWNNYYVVNNRINRSVLFYLLNKKYGVDKKEDEMYVLEFIDDNANIKHISEEDEIIFGLDEYTVTTYKKDTIANDYPSFVTKGKTSDNIDFLDQFEVDEHEVEEHEVEDDDTEFVDKYSG